MKCSKCGTGDPDDFTPGVKAYCRMCKREVSRSWRPTRANYRRMSRTERLQIGLSEPEVICPACEAKTPVAELVAHVRGRCKGPGDPPAAARWLTRQEAKALGVARAALEEWVRRRYVRAEGQGSERKYLMRDVVRHVALEHLGRSKP